MEQPLIKQIPDWADPGDKVVTGELVGPVEPGVWQAFIGMVSDGQTVPVALEKAGLTRAGLEGALRTDVKAAEAYREAKILAVRRVWDMQTIEEVLTKLMLCEQGGHLSRIIDDMGLDPSSFYQLMMRDPVIKEMYDEARQIQAEVMADKVREIADDGTNDTYVDEKGRVRVDQDVVGRSRLRLDTYKWVMSKLHYRRFGDKLQTDQNVNVTVDHAERLASGRKRLEKLHAERAGGK